MDVEEALKISLREMLDKLRTVYEHEHFKTLGTSTLLNEF